VTNFAVERTADSRHPVMDRRAFVTLVSGSILAGPLAAKAQSATKVYHVGAVLQGGPYYAALDGLRAGLKDLGFEEGKQYTLSIRDVTGDLKAAAEMAKKLEQEKVDLIYSVTTSVSLSVQQATTTVPVVFFAGRDAVGAGLVKSLAKPGGRLTGLETRTEDLVAKRLEILKEMVPKARRVIGFYNPNNPTAREYARLNRDAARQLGMELVERHVRSVDELREGLRTLKAGDGDALILPLDAMVIAHGQLVINLKTATTLGLTIPQTLLFQANPVIE
jgi:putative ABC transport system substrate-binding protein